MERPTLPLNSPPSFGQAEVSDLEIAIRGAALLDSHLETLLASALYGSATAQRRLLNGSARLRLVAYCVGLIGPQAYEDLQLIGRVRNAFAHPGEAAPLNFSDEAIMGTIGQLSNYPADQARGLNGRAVFVRAVYRLAGGLNRKLAAVRRRQGRGCCRGPTPLA